MKKHLATVLLLLVQPLGAAVTPLAHYNLKGAGGIRDTLAPEALADQAGKSPALTRQGMPKVMTQAPEARRSEYDSSIKFEQPDQCYSVAKNLVGGDNFVVEAWAYALKADDPGWHAVVANGDGGVGFILGQQGGQWAVLVGGVGGTNLGKVVPETWTHLAIVQSAGAVSGWLNGVKVAELPGLGGGRPNFAIGATAPNKENFSGWIAEVRHATFAPGKFDPAADFLMDTEQLKVVQAAEKAKRAKFIGALGSTPGLAVVKQLDERPYDRDWLIVPPALRSNVQLVADVDRQSARVMLANSLVSRTFLIKDGNLGCISMRRSDKDIEFVRAVKPEVRVNIDGTWHEVGGLKGAPDKAFITPDWFERFSSRDGAFVLTGMTVGRCVKPYEWQPKCNAPKDIAWPAKGQRVTFHFAPPASKPNLDGITVDVHYEIYDGIPVIMKSFTLHNKRASALTLTRFESEHLAVQPSNSRMMHVES
ncbi:MAG: LamG domain-containing protein, partial [Akkermansiaceae bacterium]|nr:LamG domain-containing protein [Akkermansiaceae bacterium]